MEGKKLMKRNETREEIRLDKRWEGKNGVL